jgi:hypothetical protein
MRKTVNVVGAAATDSSKMFGRKEELRCRASTRFQKCPVAR